MADEAVVQVAPDSTGKKIRNLAVYALQADGTLAQVHMQVTGLVDPDGKLIDLSPAPILLEELVELQRDTHTLLARLLGEDIEEEARDDDGPELGRILSFRARRGLPNDVASPNSQVGSMADVFGRQVIIPHAIRELVGTQATTISASTSETPIITSAPDVYADLIALIVSNTSASTSTRIDVRDQTGGTVLFSLQSIGGAAPVGFALPVPVPQTLKGRDWTVQCGTSTTDIRVYAVFVKNR